MKIIEVNVTQEDIQDGVAGMPCDCPVAYALSRVLGLERGTIAAFGPTIALLRDDGEIGVRNPVPLRVWDFVQRFDEDRRVLPFSFRLKLQDRFCRALEAAS